MTQTLDVGSRFSRRDSSQATSVPTPAAQTSAKVGTFAITFGIAFAILYTAFERLNWPLFTYHPAVNKLDFWKEPTGIGPPMFWYGWIVLAAMSSVVVAWIATMVSEQMLRRATVFCCALAAFWPAALSGLRIFIVDWATFDADFLNSVWVAAIPAFPAAAAITYLVSARLADRVWTSWLLIMPIGGLVILGFSLQQYFVR